MSLAPAPWALKRAPSGRPGARGGQLTPGVLPHPLNPLNHPLSLSRFRLSGSEVKDKSALADTRRAIERCMEAFKACERESKTRAFSQAGLAGAAARVDPREARRAEARDWIAATVAALGEGVETLDGELEALTAGGGNKRARAKAPPPRAAKLEAAIARHRAHVARLEQLLRLVDNEAVSPEEVDPVREVLDDYLAGTTGGGAGGDDGDGDGGGGGGGGLGGGGGASGGDEYWDDDPDAAYDGLLDRLDAAAAALPSVPSAAAIKSGGGGGGGGSASASGGGGGGGGGAKDGGGSVASSAAGKDSAGSRSAKATPASPRGEARVAAPPPPASPAGAGRWAGGGDASSSPKAGAGGGGGNTPGRPAGWNRAASGAVAGGDGAADDGTKAADDVDAPSAAPSAAAAAAAAAAVASAADAAEADLPPPATIPAVPPSVLQSLLTACAPRSIPTPADSAWPAVPPRVRSLPRGQPAPSYPSSRPPALDAPALFERLDAEALFFAFYYQPGTHQQYLAARELKRQSWRYHTQHGAWFQRHEEPTAATDEYERGTYVYFDYNVLHDDAQAGWCYRLKQDFTFRYDALEDELPQ